MVCQDDGSALTFQRTGVMACGLCRGRLLNRAALETIVPDWKKRLVPDPSPIRRPRGCPRCHQAMSIRHIERVPVAFDWCASCECAWLAQPDEELLRQVERRAAATLSNDFQRVEPQTRPDWNDWLDAFDDVADGPSSVFELLRLFLD